MFNAFFKWHFTITLLSYQKADGVFPSAYASLQINTKNHRKYRIYGGFMAAPVRLEQTTHLLETWSRCSSLPPSLPVSAVFAPPVYAATGSHSRCEAVNSRMQQRKHRVICRNHTKKRKKQKTRCSVSSVFAPPV